MGVAYVRFALARPGRFRLMFGPGIADRSRYPDLRAAAEAAFAHLSLTVGEGRESGPDSRLVPIRAWALVHGLAQLIMDGMLPGDDPEALARALTRRSP